jgi:hypothetical protein
MFILERDCWTHYKTLSLDHGALRGHPHLRHFRARLQDGNLWHLNRRSVDRREPVRGLRTRTRYVVQQQRVNLQRVSALKD